MPNTPSTPQAKRDCTRCNGAGNGFKINKDGKTWTFVRKCRKCRGKGRR